MHRPGIASVIGSKIFLDGTTIDEVKDYHKEALILCVKKANEEEARIPERKKPFSNRDLPGTGSFF